MQGPQLILDMRVLFQEGSTIRAGCQCDDLTSLQHVKLMDLFKRVWGDGEIMGQLVYRNAISNHDLDWTVLGRRLPPKSPFISDCPV